MNVYFVTFFFLKVHRRETIPCATCFYRVGVEVVEQWLRTDIVGCLQTFFDCQKGNFLNDPGVCSKVPYVLTCSDQEYLGNTSRLAPH